MKSRYLGRFTLAVAVGVVGLANVAGAQESDGLFESHGDLPSQ